MESRKLLISIIMIMLCSVVAFALNQNQFTNGYSIENISFANNTIQRFIQLPLYVNSSNASLIMTPYINIPQFSSFNETAEAYGLDGNSAIGIDVGATPIGYMNDSDYTTYIRTSGSLTGYVYMNYTKPTGVNGAEWRLRHGAKPTYSPIIDGNFTLPTSCFNYDASKIILRIYVASGVSSGGQCFNGAWVSVSDSSGSNGNNYGQFYEESISWTNVKNINLSLDIGDNDKVYDASYVGLSNTSNINLEFTSKLNTLGGCSCANCSVSGNYCNYPVQLYYNNTGILEVSPNITYSYLFELNNCSRGQPAFNFSIRDETSNNLLNGSYTATFNYVFNGVTGTYTATHTNRNSFSVCIYPDYARFSGNYSVFYSATDHPQRRHYDYSPTYSNITQSVNLYLQNTTTGLYARFQTIDNYQNPIANTQGDMKTTINGSLITVEQESSDSSGLMTFFADYNKDYTITFSKAGYATATYSFRPTTSDIIKIIMSSESVTNVTQEAGILPIVSPLSPLKPATVYNFVFNVTSPYWTLSKCNLSLTNETATVWAGYAGTTCNINITMNTTTSDYINLVGYYYTNAGNNTFLYNYIIYTQTEENYTLVYALNYTRATLLDSSSFGNTSFFILGILIIAAVMGAVMQYENTNLGYVQPESMYILLIVLVWILSWANFFNLQGASLPYPWLKQYIVAVLVTIFGLAFMSDWVKS